MIKKGLKIEGSKVLVLGITFKENCPDIRNSRVIDVIQELQEFGCDITVSDYWADSQEVKHEYNLELNNDVNYSDYKAIVLAVAHDKYKTLSLKTESNVVFDIKSILNDSDARL
jgi:UDP-N-acetyl-D-galactosamine dehydrogenase